MSRKGYIKIDRKIDSWEYRHDMSRLGFWLHLLLSAEWKGPERGTFITSVRELEQDTRLAKNTISKYFRELEALNQITREPVAKKTKITILKYSEYQGGIGNELRQKAKEPRSNCDDIGNELRQKAKEPRSNCDDIGNELRQKKSGPSLFNRNNEEIKSMNKRNTYTGECVDAELLDDAEIWFSEFWKVYPKHKAKATAEKAFRKVCTSAEEYRRIMAGLHNAINRDWRNIDPRYIPYPATWINGKRWEDEETPQQKTQNPYMQALIDEMKGENDGLEGNEDDPGYDPFDVSHYRKQWADG